MATLPTSRDAHEPPAENLRYEGEDSRRGVFVRRQKTDLGKSEQISKSMPIPIEALVHSLKHGFNAFRTQANHYYRIQETKDY